MGFEKTETFQTKILNPYFSNTDEDYVYKAKINVFKKTFGGILIIKKIEHNAHRVVFTTEMGNSLFDFSFEGNDFKVNRILKEMDKKILIDVLQNDFKALITENPKIIASFSNGKDDLVQTQIKKKTHFYKLEEQKLLKITRTGSQKEKVVFSFSEINDDIANQIEIAHKNFALNIQLNAI
ncbi:hypothetical protein [Maribacter sp. 2210JD10-5]|uniref:hypothetical protein n=1 Tax=Maribacter sp. 2210JD10-5 TaxID=3386272 RepID=UPI0039BC6ABF